MNGNSSGSVSEEFRVEARPRFITCVWARSVLAVVGGAAVIAVANSAPAQDAPTRLEAKFQMLVQEQGLGLDQVALLAFSTRYRSILVQYRAAELMPAASNAQLVTAYAALRALTPNFRWRTRVFRVADHDGAVDAGRQGLLIEGVGDPTVTYADLERVAQRLRAAGIRKLGGRLYLDGSLYGRGPGSGGAEPPGKPMLEAEPTDLPGRNGPIGDDHAAPTAPSAFIVERNAPELHIGLPEGGASEVLSSLPADAVRIVARLRASSDRRSVLTMDQAWDGTPGTVVLMGTVPPGRYTVRVPISQPAEFFAHLVRAALRSQGIDGALPLGDSLPAGAPRDLIAWHDSPPLREAIRPVLQDNDSLVADRLTWTLAAQGRPPGKTAAVDPEDGLRAVRRVMLQDFPGIQDEMELIDSSGSTGASRLSARALVRVLYGAMARPDFGPEFVSALSRAAWEGTLRYRSYAAPLHGRLRAKAGTLAGVANLTGVLPLAQDEAAFSFLIAAPDVPREKLQAAQDRIVAALYEALRKEEILGAEPDPLAPRPLAPPPPSSKPGRRRSLKPPPASPKPKAGGSSSSTGVG